MKGTQVRRTRPYGLKESLGRLCEAGQHLPCPVVSDPYDDAGGLAMTVWVCSCSCHREPQP